MQGHLKEEKDLLNGMVVMSDGQPLPGGTTHFLFLDLMATETQSRLQELMVGIVDGMSYETGVPTPSINDVIFDLGQILRVEIAENE